MVENARLIGADAVIAVRFDSSEIGQQFTEIVAYGTAVKVDPAPERPMRVRLSDADRELLFERLNRHAAAGRLDVDGARAPGRGDRQARRRARRPPR